VNLANVPTWAWVAFGVLAFLLAKRKGWLDPSPPAANDAPPPAAKAAQIVELRHVVDATAGAETSPGPKSDLAETRRVGFEFDVSIVPRPKGGNPP
jgi:hypothetical protein